ncbi:hypothetical protein Lal_00027856 [Lupinus albus]|nr:hypothetical protein Lal_00027856 [Lupinus albus]
MKTKYELEKFNGSNIPPWKLKIKTILRKDNCLAATEGGPTKVTDNKWKEMDDNGILIFVNCIVVKIVSYQAVEPVNQ